MANPIHARMTASVTEFKRNPMGTLAAGDGAAVAILNHTQPAFYCVPAETYARMREVLEDAELNALAEARRDMDEVPVSLDEL